MENSQQKYTLDYYWKNKTERAAVAKTHTIRMQEEHKIEIENAIRGSVVYRGDIESLQMHKTEKRFLLVNEDTVSAIFNHAEGKTAVLNFASYKKPGGMFIEGSRAQEECLCHESFLYNVLKELAPYYEINKTRLNRALYTNAAVYTPAIRFFRNGSQDRYADVITCAAPNKTAAIKYKLVTEDENNKALKDRIHFVKCVVEKQQFTPKTIILGAYGCGVFGQDPDLVANTMIDEFSDSSIENIIFAVPGNDENYKTFQNVFKERKL